MPKKGSNYKQSYPPAISMNHDNDQHGKISDYFRCNEWYSHVGGSCLVELEAHSAGGNSYLIL